MRRLFLCLIILAAALPAAAKLRLVDISDQIDFGRDSVGCNTCEVVVVHSSYYAGKGHGPFWRQGVIDQYRQYDVSPHYLIDRDGTVYRMAPDTCICWHAGTSLLPGTERDSLNNCAIGIEIINSKAAGPSDAQYAALASLLNNPVEQYPVTHILGHSDIAPGRKTDPWAFSWRRLRRLVGERARAVFYRKQ